MNSPYRIPFNKPSFVGNELAYIEKAVASEHWSGDGLFTKRCHKLLSQTLESARVLLTTSCTHALEMSALLLNIKDGDEVIMPSFTFVSTANAFALRGAKIVFADVRPDTLNIDEKQLPALITKKTKAIVPVHYAGVGCEMNAILPLAQSHRIAVVEDNAHGLFGTYQGKQLGTFGALATQSFHETKNFQCGEGGALLINREELAERAEIIREKGTHRTKFFRGQVDKYTWVDMGSSYLPSDILAAILYAQLERRETIQATRKMIWHLYYDNLSDWASQQGVILPTVPEHCGQAYHLFYLLLPSLDERQRFIQHLKAKGIQSVYHYLPLHISQMGQSFGAKPGDCPVTEKVSDCLVRLPFYNALSVGEAAQVVEAVKSFKTAFKPQSQAIPLFRF